MESHIFGVLGWESSSRDLQQDGFSQSWLVQISSVNLCRLPFNLLWVNSFSYDQIVCSLGEPFHTKQPDYFILRMIISLLFEHFVIHHYTIKRFVFAIWHDCVFGSNGFLQTAAHTLPLTFSFWAQNPKWILKKKCWPCYTVLTLMI